MVLLFIYLDNKETSRDYLGTKGLMTQIILSDVEKKRGFKSAGN